MNAMTFFFFFTNSYFIIDIYAISNSVLAFPGLLYLIKEEKKGEERFLFVFLRLPKSVLIMTKKKKKKYIFRMRFYRSNTINMIKKVIIIVVFINFVSLSHSHA
jgi:hypothetical protein